MNLTGRMRYLTAEAKARELAAWGEVRKAGIPAGNQAGKGYPDPNILSWCDRLNALPGICTLQSCSGHLPRNGDPGPHPGHLWLHLSEPMARAFSRRAFKLARQDGIEEVSCQFKEWGQEIVSLVFAGDDRGLLASSMDRITSFFEALSDSG